MVVCAPWGAERMAGHDETCDGGAAGIMTGLVEGTRIATAMGWRPVEAIAMGDKVLTFDAGLQRVTEVLRDPLWSGESACPRRFWPLEVPRGALGNRTVIRVLPDQAMLLESDAAEALYGDPFALLPGEVLEGIRGIARVPPERNQQVVVLHFAEDQVVFDETGALFFAPSSRDLMDRAMHDRDGPLYTVLPPDEARALAAQIEIELSSDTIPLPRDMRAAVSSF
ncbi:Hint domain-containing protein [Roseovarius sp.]|uniref:Hint domain-containing protein n=2 Tax=Roseovarius TaxID=74030 RepID=UPI003564FB44